MLYLATIAYNKPHLVAEQIRLLRKHLADEFELWVIDNSDDAEASGEIRNIVLSHLGVIYERPKISPRMHHLALNHVAGRFREQRSEYFGFLDHDVFPTRETCVLPILKEQGFLGIGQRAPATGGLYPWPGWFFCSAEWLNRRDLDFGGHGGGDTGSALQDLFTEDDWLRLYRVGHGYGALRHPDEVGLQSWGYEEFATDKESPPDWVHFSNGSEWMQIPDPENRRTLIFDKLAAL